MYAPISTEKLSDTISVSLYPRDAEHPEGYWLYDKTRDMNIAIAAPTKEQAFLKALEYYQKRLKDEETELAELRNRVDNFVSQLVWK